MKASPNQSMNYDYDREMRNSSTLKSPERIKDTDQSRDAANMESNAKCSNYQRFVFDQDQENGNVM